MHGIIDSMLMSQQDRPCSISAKDWGTVHRCTHLTMQCWMRGCTEAGPEMKMASLKPVMSMSMLRMTQVLLILNVGLFALWSILVSPSWPDPSISRRFPTFTASLHNPTSSLKLSFPQPKLQAPSQMGKIKCWLMENLRDLPEVDGKPQRQTTATAAIPRC